MARCRGDTNDTILNGYTYSSLEILKRSLKNRERLQEHALYKDDDTTISILTDITKVVNNLSSILTRKQYEAVELVLLKDLNEVEAAETLDITQQAVHYRIKSALRRISSYLESGTVYRSVFSESQTAKITELYLSRVSPKEIASRLDLPVRSVRNKIRYLRRTGLKGVTGYGPKKGAEV